MSKQPIVLEFRKVIMADEDRQDIHAIGDKIEDYYANDIEYTGYYLGDKSLKEIAEDYEE